jgi:glycosyltransferase involved in cell wall biosynthesis
MAERALHIAWLGPAPGSGGGVPGVATDLMEGLAQRGHRIDAFFPSSGQPIPDRLQGRTDVSFHWGTSTWKWDRWYSRTRITAFLSGMVARALASLRLRREISDHHRSDPFDLLYQFSSIESLGLPARLRREVPVVLHPETHAAGELRAMVAERREGLRCHPPHRFATVLAIMFLRTLAQRVLIRRASLLVCISGVFRDHLVADYGFPRERTLVTANPVRMERFEPAVKAPGEPPRVLVLGRIAVRKGIEDVVAAAHILRERGVDMHFRIVGGPSLWSDYTPLLEDLPADSAEYAGRVEAEAIAGELASSDVLLQASRYEPFALTVAEALAEGVPVVGTSEVGAIEGVDRSVAAEVAPGQPEQIADALVATVERVRSDPQRMRELARSEAQRLFAPEVVCATIATGLEQLVTGDMRPWRAEVR